jgi:hypothetical protein
MTVQAGIELDLDIAAMVGELEAPKCEHTQHQTYRDVHADKPASHYIRGYCECTGWSEAYAACPKFVSKIQQNGWNECPGCDRIEQMSYFFQILGPIQ